MAKGGPRYWLCQGCRYRNLRTHTKCRGFRPDGTPCQRTKPKPKVAKHAEVLRDTSYEAWAELSVKIHGGELHACGCCGRFPSKVRHNDRDHDHDTGRARGLACPGRYGCNIFMPQGLTAARAQQIADYLKRVDEYYASHQAEGGENDA